MSKIPSKWRIEKLEKLAGKITSGGTPKADNPLYYNGHIPFIKIDDITQSKSIYLNDSKTKITEQALKNSSAKLYPPGTLLVTMYGTIGEVVITSKELASSQAICAIWDFKNVNTLFLAYFLKLKKDYLSSLSGKTTQANISGEILKNLEVLVPPLNEQKKIAEILTSVDRVIELTSLEIDKLKDLKKGMMQELLTKGIGHTKFKDSPVGKIPESWDYKELAEIASPDKFSFNNGPFGSDLLSSEMQESGVKVIFVQDIKDGMFVEKSSKYVTNDKAKSLEASQVFFGDIVITKVGDPPGIAAVYERNEMAIITQDVVRLRVNSKNDNHFIKYLLNSHIGTNAIDAIAIKGTRKRFSLTEFKKLSFFVPNKKEQEAISKILISLDQKIIFQYAKLSKLQDAKKGLMNDLLTGKVRVKV